MQVGNAGGNSLPSPSGALGHVTKGPPSLGPLGCTGGGLGPREPALGCLAQEEETRVVCGGLEAASTLAGAVLRAGEEQPVPRPANKSARREM